MNKPNIKSHSVDNILDRVKKAYNMDTDVELADFFSRKANTISAWRKRDSMDYDLLFTKCDNKDLNWIIYGVGNPEIERPSKKMEVTKPLNDQQLQDLIESESKSIALVKRIENGPWSQKAKLLMIESLIRIVEKDLAEVRREPKSSKDE